MLDADAHLGRRAWVACPSCGNGGCASCAAGKTCDLHWQYLLASQARLLFLVPRLHVPMVARYPMRSWRRPPRLRSLWELATYRGRAA
jgi:hypothetical protein